MRLLAPVVVLLAAHTCLMGQPAPAPDKESQEAELQRIREKLAELEQKIEQQKQERREPASVASFPGLETLEQTAPTRSPLDLSGYFSFRYFNDNSAAGIGSFQAHIASFFLGKTLGRWRFHSELEFEYAPHFRAGGESRGEILLETSWLNYNHKDWLNARAGLLLMPTYWRVHHYPSTTLTVQNPLIDRRIFPADIVGAMVHGSRQYEEGGFRYSFYAGNGSGPDPGRRAWTESKATGGTFLVHVPTGHFLRTFDFGVQLYKDAPAPSQRQRIYGFETLMEKGRFSFLGEFAHADVTARQSSRLFFREGFYLQPSVRLTRRLFGVYRFDRLDHDSRVASANDWRRHTAGLVYRPMPQVSLKLELNQNRSEGNSRPGFSGLAAGVAFFFQ